MEFGPAEHGMGGASPVSWTEIEAWLRVTKTEMPGWEALLLRELSQEYCGALGQSKKPNAPEPAMSKDENRARATNDFRTLVNQLKDDNGEH